MLTTIFHGLYSCQPKKWCQSVQNFAVKPLAIGLWLYAQAYLDGALIINLNTAPLYKIHDYNYNNFRIPSHFPENLEQRGT